MKTPKFYKKDGTEDTARSKRYARIVSGIGHLAGTSVKCPALGGVPVIITKHSIEEIAFHASKSAKSTAAALDVVNQIKTCCNPKANLPKKNRQQTIFRFIILYTLYGTLKGNKTKITIGARRNGKHLQYCITVI